MFVNLSTVDGLKETITTLGEKFNKEDKAKEEAKVVHHCPQHAGNVFPQQIKRAVFR